MNNWLGTGTTQNRPHEVSWTVGFGNALIQFSSVTNEEMMTRLQECLSDSQFIYNDLFERLKTSKGDGISGSSEISKGNGLSDSPKTSKGHFMPTIHGVSSISTIARPTFSVHSCMNQRYGPYLASAHPCARMIRAIGRFSFRRDQKASEILIGHKSRGRVVLLCKEFCMCRMAS